jgi:hypothetical protein
LEQLLAAKLTSQGCFSGMVALPGQPSQSGEGFRKKVLKINAFLTLLTIEKINAPVALKPSRIGIYSQVWD